VPKGWLRNALNTLGRFLPPKSFLLDELMVYHGSRRLEGLWRSVTPLACMPGRRGHAVWVENRYSCRAPKEGLRGALMTPGRFLTPSGIALDKLPWFAMVLVAVGGRLALDNASCVRGAGENT
jgi:hypothetical protein